MWKHLDIGQKGESKKKTKKNCSKLCDLFVQVKRDWKGPVFDVDRQNTLTHEM